MTTLYTDNTAMSETLVKAVVNATTEVLHTMAGTTVNFQGVHNSVEDRQIKGDLSAVIGMTGDNGEGTFSLTFTENLANILVGRLAGMDPGMIGNEDRTDGVRELVNMIIGGAKAALARETDSSYRLSIPMVIAGQGHAIYNPKAATSVFLVVHFEAEGEPFYLDITFKMH